MCCHPCRRRKGRRGWCPQMTGHDDENHGDGPIEVATWDVSRARLYTYLSDGCGEKGQTGQTLQEHARNARGSVNLGRHLGRSVEGRLHASWSCEPCVLLQSRRKLRRRACVVARRKQLQIIGNVLKERFEVQRTGDIGPSTEDAKELRILYRTIKIDVQNEEMIWEANTMFF